jgi:hypothetical protein
MERVVFEKKNPKLSDAKLREGILIDPQIP